MAGAVRLDLRVNMSGSRRARRVNPPRQARGSPPGPDQACHGGCQRIVTGLPTLFLGAVLAVVGMGCTNQVAMIGSQVSAA
jgi:hypothetical protein